MDSSTPNRLSKAAARFVYDLGLATIRFAKTMDPDLKATAQQHDPKADQSTQHDEGLNQKKQLDEGLRQEEEHTARSPEDILMEVKRQAGHSSWVMLRKALLEQTGAEPHHTTPQVAASSRSFARKALTATGLTAEQILEIMSRRGWGTT